MGNYKFGWGNGAKIEALFNVAPTTLNRWTKEKPERCELLEKGLYAYLWLESMAVGMMPELTKENLKAALALIGFTSPLSKLCPLLPIDTQWSMRQSERSPALLFGLFLGLSEIAIVKTLAENPDLKIDSIERRMVIVSLFYMNRDALDIYLNSMTPLTREK